MEGEAGRRSEQRQEPRGVVLNTGSTTPRTTNFSVSASPSLHMTGPIPVWGGAALKINQYVESTQNRTEWVTRTFRLSPPSSPKYQGSSMFTEMFGLSY